MPTILILCTGNYCRSPLAEALMRFRLKQANIDQSISVRSAGITATYEGFPPARRVIEVLAELGITGSIPRPHLVQPDELTTARLILGVTREHVDWVKHNYPQASDRTILLTNLIGETWDVFDPGVHDLDLLRTCRDTIDRVIVQGMPELIRRVQSPADLIE